MVLFHHAILAYTSFAYINPENPIRTFSPVVDTQRWIWFDLIVGFNDTFFMALMFFISGLFAWQSLKRKGAWIYLTDRFKRLGLPFVIGVLVLIPLALYPAQLLVERIYGGDTGYGQFWFGMIRSGFGTAGPLWFLWLLLIFDCLVAFLYQAIGRSFSINNRCLSVIFERPLAFWGALVGVSIILYLPMLIFFGLQQWLGIGPFIVQACRIPLYLVYFLAGMAISIYGLDLGLLNSESHLVRQCWGWFAAGLVSFSIYSATYIFAADQYFIQGFTFSIACAAIVFSFIAIFLRFANQHSRVIDSLNRNAYGMYILHYMFVTWLQYGLLDANLFAWAKGALVFVCTLVFSWGSTVAIRRIPAVAKVI